MHSGGRSQAVYNVQDKISPRLNDFISEKSVRTSRTVPDRLIIILSSRAFPVST